MGTVKRIFVQGDRDAVGMEEAARQLGRLVAAKEGWGFNLGAYGELIPLIAAGGADCVCHETAAMGKAPKTPNLPNVSIVSCASWGTRLDAFLASDAFLFFSGRQGTIAHLAPILAHIVKGEIDKGKTPRKVALVGWEPDHFIALCRLMQIECTTTKRWLRCYSYLPPARSLRNAVAFLTTASAS